MLEQVARFDAPYRSTMAEPRCQIMRQQHRIMADPFTRVDIFYASPVGRSVMGKVLQPTTVIRPTIIRFVRGAMPRLLPELLRIIGL